MLVLLCMSVLLKVSFAKIDKCRTKTSAKLLQILQMLGVLIEGCYLNTDASKIKIKQWFLSLRSGLFVQQIQFNPSTGSPFITPTGVLNANHLISPRGNASSIILLHARMYCDPSRKLGLYLGLVLY